MGIDDVNTDTFVLKFSHVNIWENYLRRCVVFKKTSSKK